MNFLFLLHLIISFNCYMATENLKVYSRSGISDTSTEEIQTPKKQNPGTDLYSKRNLLNMQPLERIENENVVSSNRKSKILRSLAFLAGLSVGDLAGAASSDVKTYNAFPPLTLTLSVPRISPYIASIYEPYPYMTHPYVSVTPPRLQTLWNLLVQNSQMLNMLDNTKPSNLLNKDDEYVEEAKKIENIKTVSNTNEETNNSIEIQKEENLNVGEKISSGNTCNIHNGNTVKQGSLLESASKERENANEQSFRAANTTGQMTSINATNQNTTQTQNTTMSHNQTNVPFYGYYNGHPQDINYISFTTETYDHKYHDYEHINYNLPSYERPVNFYSDERHNYHLVPPNDRYASNQFHHEHIPEYLPNDFKRFVYTSDNTPFANSDFRPLE
ncbi:hypothetical protein ANTQUA_LOCUS2913 [Anthophora quadrimaculata]